MLLPNSYFITNTIADSKKVKGFIITIAILYPLWWFFLWWLWYSKSPLTNFHFFNDLNEWLQMDKVGHAVVNFHWAFMPAIIFAWAGIEIKKAALLSFIMSMIVLVPVEVMDGFSVSWGFSIADMIANLLGSTLAYAQLRGWQNIKIAAKFSFSYTDIYTLVRPDMFGTNYIQSSLKDYNGQTYWLTFDINALIGKKILPKWLLLSIGYSGENMFGGHDNVWTDAKGEIKDYSHLIPYRQVYISFDINFTEIVKNKVLQRVLYPVNIFKVPFPAIEISENGIRFHWLYI
jgi:Predicted periplasmic lipoprotein (DUF2279)